MDNAFQQDAFQNNAFQIEIITVSEEVPSLRVYTDRYRKEMRRRHPLPELRPPPYLDRGRK